MLYHNFAIVGQNRKSKFWLKLWPYKFDLLKIVIETQNFVLRIKNYFVILQILISNFVLHKDKISMAYH